MIASQSGEEKKGTWVTEECNIYQDYIASFGHEPPMTSGVAIMTDSDNTKESAMAFYADIFLNQARKGQLLEAANLHYHAGPSRRVSN